MRALIKNFSPNAAGNKGFTLVELLIVLALSSLLSAALFQIVLGNKQNIQLTDSYSKVQESTRYAMDYLAKDFRMAGYMGCVNNNIASSKITNMLDSDDDDYESSLHSFENVVTAIDNYDADNPDHVNAINGIAPIEGTDVFSSSSALATDLMVESTHSAVAANFSVSGPENQRVVLAEGMILMVTDCNTAHIFSVSNNMTANHDVVAHNKNVSNGIDNKSSALGINYPAGSQVLLMNTTTYFVGASAIIDGHNSLYRSSTLDGGVPEELVPFIEDMQLIYSVDTNNDRSPDIYKTAAEIAADGDDIAANVYSVNIELIVSGDVDVGAPVLNGYENDGKLRKRYARVVNIRNAGLASF